MMIPFSPPRIDQKIIDEVVDTLKSGWITTGPKTKLLEKKITEYCKNKTTLCVNSATSGLELVLRWFGVGVGDEVILPAYTYCATANVIIHCGAKPVMVDINQNDFNISINAIEKAITKKTKVIIPVDIAGLPCDYNLLHQLINKKSIRNLFQPKNNIQEKLKRILVLSDAAHSFGASYQGKKVGCHTDITVFSFHAVKNLTTGEGGAISFHLPDDFNTSEIYDFFNVFSLHGQNKDAFTKLAGNWKYDVMMAGYKANMTDVLASIALVELNRYESEDLPRRREIFNNYYSFFGKFDWAELPISLEYDKVSSYHLFLLRIKDADLIKRDEIIKKIQEKEVSVNVHFQPLPLLTFYKNQGYNINNFPNAYNSYEKVVSLPVYYNLDVINQKLVCEAVQKSVEEVLYAK